MGCIEAKCCKKILKIIQNMRWKALAEIYTMHSFAPFGASIFSGDLNFRRGAGQNPYPESAPTRLPAP